MNANPSQSIAVRQAWLAGLGQRLGGAHPVGVRLKAAGASFSYSLSPVVIPA
jgi:hypothetical protein